MGLLDAVRRQRLTWRPVRPGGWWLDGLLIAGFVALTVALSLGQLLAADQAVANWMDAHRPTPLRWTAQVLNFLGQGGWLLMPLTAALAATVAWRRRSVRPLVVVVAAFALTYLTIGPVKLFADRAAPRFPADNRAELFNELASGRYAMSYPSGHVVNALVWYGAIAVLIDALLRSVNRSPLPGAARMAVRVVPPAIVCCTTTYLSWHWLTDSVAGVLIGVVLARLLARVLWDGLSLPTLRGGWDRAAGL